MFERLLPDCWVYTTGGTHGCTCLKVGTQMPGKRVAWSGEDQGVISDTRSMNVDGKRTSSSNTAGVKMISLDSVWTGFTLAQNVEKKKTESETPLFLCLNQDIATWLQE